MSIVLTMPNLITLLGKAARKPPGVVAHRLIGETRRFVDRYSLRPDGSWPTERQLLADLNAASIDQLWERLAAQPYVAAGLDPLEIRSACSSDEHDAMIAAAERALNHQVDLLGSGPTSLGEQIAWNRDCKTGHCWPNQFAGDIEYTNLDQPSDVKFPWELSRLQWLIPAGQAYLLTGDQRYAAAVKRIMIDWIDANPYAWSVNWSCTMEVAMRIFSWTWFFHAFHASEAWSEQPFRRKFLSALYAHGRFTEQYLEFSDINGNHCTADAAAMVFAGLFFGGGDTSGPRAPRRWQRAGWRLLEKELPKQVTPDGVDFEGSVPYHRLCAELFFLPALYRERCGLATPPEYRDRVIAMARFTQAYTKPGGLAPLIGDADDARTLPFGRQAVNDHRYLPTLIGSVFDVAELVDDEQRVAGECMWMLGATSPLPAGEQSRPEQAQRSSGRADQSHTQTAGTASPRLLVRGLHSIETSNPTAPLPSPLPRGERGRAFPDGGYYVFRNASDHVFLDAAPIGQGGRGGHGHNDCLSFEAVLCGVPLVTDCGAYIYTGSYRERNRFRSTHAHNTPIIDGEEINRLHGERMLWTMHNDAQPTVRRCSLGGPIEELEASHSGYQRLTDRITPVRLFRLDHSSHELTITDRFEAESDGRHSIEIPLHFDPGTHLEEIDRRHWRLSAAGSAFSLRWDAEGDWQCALEPCRVSPSYGVAVESQRLVWRYAGSVRGAMLSVTIARAEDT